MDMNLTKYTIEPDSMFIDSHYTFWGQGKSYLCRFIDTLNMGLIDELIVGKEVLTRWREVLTEFTK